MSDLILAEISAETLPVITYRNQAVFTTELLAKVFAINPKNLHMNYKNSSDQFIASRDYSKIIGDELSDFGEAFNRLYTKAFGLQISSKARSLFLWTERGVALHAKMLNTPMAWKIYNKLIDFYFRKRDEHDFSDLGLTVKERQAAERELRFTLKELGASNDLVANQINRKRAIRLCYELGYDISDIVTHEQIEMEV